MIFPETIEINDELRILIYVNFHYILGGVIGRLRAEENKLSVYVHKLMSVLLLTYYFGIQNFFFPFLWL